MKSLGAGLPFDGAKANFSHITNDPAGLYISAVVHNAVIEVNEEGSEAAAATGVIMETNCFQILPEPFEFKCNRPFLFVIHDTNKHAVLFYGKYAQPE